MNRSRLRNHNRRFRILGKVLDKLWVTVLAVTLTNAVQYKCFRERPVSRPSPPSEAAFADVMLDNRTVCIRDRNNSVIAYGQCPANEGELRAAKLCASAIEGVRPFVIATSKHPGSIHAWDEQGNFLWSIACQDTIPYEDESGNRDLYPDIVQYQNLVGGSREELVVSEKPSNLASAIRVFSFENLRSENGRPEQVFIYHHPGQISSLAITSAPELLKRRGSGHLLWFTAISNSLTTGRMAASGGKVVTVIGCLPGNAKGVALGPPYRVRPGSTMERFAQAMPGTHEEIVYLIARPGFQGGTGITRVDFRDRKDIRRMSDSETGADSLEITVGMMADFDLTFEFGPRSLVTVIPGPVGELAQELAARAEGRQMGPYLGLVEAYFRDSVLVLGAADSTLDVRGAFLDGRGGVTPRN